MLYIMRHGKTEWNRLGKLQGQTDIPLSGEGRAMAAAVAAECKKIGFDVCYCSPLSRAVETARIIFGDGANILSDARLLEMAFGKYEGAPMRGDVPEPIKTLFSDPVNYSPDGGAESFESLFSRTGGFLNDISPLIFAGKNVLIIGHGAMNASIICRVKGIPLSNFWSALTDNCKLVRLR